MILPSIRSSVWWKSQICTFCRLCRNLKIRLMGCEVRTSQQVPLCRLRGC